MTPATHQSERPEKPRLLVLASTYPRWRDDHEPGFVHELSRRLANDYEVIALVPDAPGADASGMLDGVEVVRYRYAPRRLQTLVNNGGIAVNLQRAPWKWLLVPGFVLAQYWQARRLVAKRRIDVVHAHWLLPQGLIARGLSRSHRVPYLVTSHGGDLFGLRGRLSTALKRRVAQCTAGMTVVSSAMRQEADRIGLCPPRMQVIPMGVDLRERFIPDANVPREASTLLFVGRLVAKKGLPHLLDALPLVLADRPDAILKIAGFGPEEQALRAQAQRLGIADRVQFLGATPQQSLPDLYRRASLFVAPFVRDESGNQEGLPVVLMEAIGCGCPVIVGDVAGIADLLGESHLDVSVDPTDTRTLATSILRALQNPSKASAQIEAIRAAALESIDWTHIAAGYATAIEIAMNRSTPD